MIGITVLLVFLAFIFICWGRKLKKLPLGPLRIPFLGSIPFVTLKRGLFDWVLDKAVTQHKIATVGLGPRNLFVINDFHMAKELFGKEEYSGRHANEFIVAHKAFDGRRYGIIMTEGSQWVNQRRFSLKTLKNLGFAKQSLEEVINIEIEEILNIFLLTKDDYLLSSDFNIPIINILWQMVTGQRFTEDDAEGVEMVASVNRVFKDAVKMAMIPISILKAFPKVTEYEENVYLYDLQKRVILKQIDQHDKTRDVDNPRDFIDMYLNEMESGVDENKFTKKDLALIMMDFLHAGTETSSTTLKWIVLYLTLYPEVQDRCRAEIQTMLGTSSCSVADMLHLPFVQATISEVQRIAKVAPLSVSHRNTISTEVDKWVFPAGSVFFANLAAIMMDPVNFQYPEQFDPERFIGPDGRYDKKERMVPFGIGRRYCMGEVLARNEVFLFTVNLIQKVKCLPPAHHPQPDAQKYHSGVTNIPEDFYLSFVKTE